MVLPLYQSNGERVKRVKTLEVLDKVLKGKRIKPNTQRHYREALGSLARCSEEWPVSGVVINEWLGGLEGFSDSTVRMWFDFVNSAGKYIEKAYKVENPCKVAERPKVSKKRRRIFTPDELVRIMGSCRFSYDKELILTLVDSTCRIGELVGLCGKDVGVSWIDVQGKTGQRRYRLDERICQALRVLAGSSDGLVFKSEDGKALNADSLTSRARRIIVRSGLTGKKLGPHTLRHSSASLIALKTRSALAVKALLQHDNIDTSMQYIHDVEDVIQQEISPLGLIGESVGVNGGGHVAEELLLPDGSKEVVEFEGEVIEGEGYVVDGETDLIADMFPDVQDGIEVRPLLKTEDLRLIRRAFMMYGRHSDDRTGVMKARELMKRVLRRVRVR